MAKTKLEITARAHRVLGLLAVDENPSADMIAFAGDTLDGVIDELEYIQGVSAPFDSDSVPDELFLPLGDLLAAEIAPHYSVPAPSRARAMTRVRAHLAPDDR